MQKVRKIQRILAPLDGSSIAECILNYVRTIARGEDTEVHLLHVVQIPVVAFSDESAVTEYVESAMEADESWAKGYLELKSRELQAAGIKTRKIIIRGKAAETINDYATKNEIDLIIISSHGRSGFSKWALGSVTEKVAHTSTVPVLIIPPEYCKGALKERA